MYAVCVILQGIYGYGGGGTMVSTRTTASLSATETAVIHVQSTTGFRTGNATLYYEDEMIYYTGVTPTTFTGLTRGIYQTKAVAHPVGIVYTQELGTMNQAAGFNVAQTEATSGTIGAMGFNIGTLLRAVPQVVVWNYSFLEGQLIYLRVILCMVGVGLTATMVISLAVTMSNVFR